MCVWGIFVRLQLCTHSPHSLAIYLSPSIYLSHFVSGQNRPLVQLLSLTMLSINRRRALPHISFAVIVRSIMCVCVCIACVDVVCVCCCAEAFKVLLECVCVCLFVFVCLHLQRCECVAAPRRVSLIRLCDLRWLIGARIAIVVRRPPAMPALAYRNLHRFFLLGSGGSRAAKMASSKTFFSPFWNTHEIN